MRESQERDRTGPGSVEVLGTGVWEEWTEMSSRTEVMKGLVQLKVDLLMPFSVLSQGQSSPFGALV